MWDHTDDNEKQYRCESDIYILSCLTLEFYIIINRSVGAPGHVKDVASGMNARCKWMIKL